MKNPINVTHRFKNPAVLKLNLSPVEVYSFPFTTPGVSVTFSPPEWALEYHYDYAGKINFLTPGRKNGTKREKYMVHLYAPGCLFREDTRKSAIPRQETYMRFKGGELCGLSEFTDAKRRYCRFLDKEKMIGTILERAACLCSSQGDKAFWRIQSLLSDCIFILLNYSKKISRDTFEISDRSFSGDSFAETVESYIRRNISLTIKNSELAGRMNLSESTFNHRFKEITGMSPKARGLEIKIDTAKGLLLKGKRLKEVAQLTGFHDEFHLSKTFKKLTGASPSEFRSRGRKI